MGLTLGIVAAPCLGPFILGLLTYVGQKGDPFLGFLYFFVLSVGLGLPLAILAVFSGALEKLPVSGAWMVWIRKVLGWVLVGMAAYLLQPLMPGASMKAMLFAGILVAAGLHLGWMDKGRGDSRFFEYIKKGWTRKKSINRPRASEPRSGVRVEPFEFTSNGGGGTALPRRGKRRGATFYEVVKKGLGAILICAAISFYFGGRQGGEGVRWTPYSEALLVEAAKENRPVMLDFYADWCGPCKSMERNVFTDPEIVDLSRHFVTLRIDLTKQHPDQKKILRRYLLMGVPTIIFINGKGIEERGLRIEAYTDREEVLKRMKRLIDP
jgi:thiol:disulfide interchange protein DsbD